MSREELKRLYETEMVIDFPPSELKPLSAMYRLMDAGRYEPLRAAQDGETVGYAMLWQPGLLDYLAVLRGRRDSGLGGAILRALMEAYGSIFGEAEAPEAGDAAQRETRERRLAFYLRNGMRLLDYDCALFGVHYRCLYAGPETDDRKIQALHRSVYASSFSPEHMARYIQLPLKPGEPVRPAPEWMEETC